MKYPVAVARDSGGHLFIVDQGNSRIIRVDDMSGKDWTTFGSFGTGTNQFKYPEGIALDAGGACTSRIPATTGSYASAT